MREGTISQVLAGEARNPYLVHGPALISVSGGRTSGFMLRKIIDAHGGRLPADVVPVFCNTGREHEATLIFLREMGERWCPIVWLEYCYRPVIDVDGSRVHGFAVVDYCSASRRGEPFEQMIVAKNFLPNPVMRLCTSELKIRTGNRYARHALGWSEWDRAVGLRADEPRRVAKMRADESAESVILPIATAGHSIDDVRAFWREQPFDLELPMDDPAFGNCDLCFLKRRAKLEKVMQSDPTRGEWWARQEERGLADGTSGGRFRNDRPTYRQMLTQISVQGRLLDDAIQDEAEMLPCDCTD